MACAVLALTLPRPTAAAPDDYTLAAGGMSFSLLLKADGTVWGWGRADYGQLGIGAPGSSYYTAPVQATGLSGITAITAGEDSALALQSDGSVWGWGRNDNGEAGVGNYSQQNTPVKLSTLSGMTALDSGIDHSLAVKSDGTVWAWGANNSGQLGDNSQSNRNAPVQTANLTNVTAVAAGDSHSLALKSDGTVWAWGRNDYGQLGDNSFTTPRTTPVQVSGLTNVTAIAAGSDSSVALTSDGTVWVWGLNSSGQLGITPAGNLNVPTQVPNFSGVVGIIAGQAQRIYARKADGKVFAWGFNNGYLGDGTSNDRFSPYEITGLNGATVIAAGFSHNLAIGSNGGVLTWGSNDWGQLGNGSAGGSSSSPAQASVGVGPLPPAWNSPAGGSTQVDTVAFSATTTDANGDNWYAIFEVHGNGTYTDLRKTVTGATVASGNASTASWTIDVAAGTYYLRVRATDSNGDVSTWRTLGAVTLDRAPTTPNWNTPADASSHTDTVSFSATATDPDTDNYAVTFEVHGNGTYTDLRKTVTGATVASGTASAGTWTVDLNAGTYYIRARAVDSRTGASGWTAGQRSIIVNRSPNAPGSLAPAGNNWVSSLTPTLSWSFSDPDAGASQSAFQVLIKNGSGTLIHDSGQVNSGIASYSVPAAVLVDGNYTWTVRTWDEGSLVGPYAAEAAFRVDATAPGGTAGPLDAGQATTAFDVPWTAGDGSGAGVTSVKLYYSTNSGSTWTQYGGTYTTSPIDFTAAGEGTYAFSVRALDGAGNEEAAPSGAGSVETSTTVDLTAPAGTASALPAFQSSTSFNVPWTASDGGGSGVASVKLYYSTNGGTTWTQYGGTYAASPIAFTAAGDGAYVFSIRARDNAGNEEPAPSGAGSVEASTTVDTTLPSASAGALPAHQTGMNFDVAWTGEPDVTSVRLYYSADGGSTWTQYGGTYAGSPIAFTAGSQGSYAFNIRAKDGAGNEEAAPTGAGSIEASTLVDTAAPTGTASALTTYQTSATFNVPWTASDGSGSGVASVKLYYSTDGGTTWTQSGGNYAASPISFTAPVAEGTYAFSVRALDNAGNEEAAPSGAGSVEASTTLDLTAPAGTATALSAYRNSTTFDIPWTASDSRSGVASVKLYYSRNGGTTWTQSGGTYSTTPIAFTAAGAGPYAFSIRALDNAGNEEAAPSGAGSVEASTTIDTTAPAGTAAALPALQASTTFNVPWTASDAGGAGVASVKLYYSTSGGATWTQFGSTFATSPIAFTAAGDGAYAFSIRALDNAGNEEAAPAGAGSVEATTTVDTTLPNAAATALPAYQTATSFNVAWTGAGGATSVRLYYSTDGGANWTQYGAISTTSPIAFVAAGDGAYAFSVQARNDAGTEEAVPSGAGSIEASTTVDTTPPAATAEPLPAAFSGPVLPVAWTGSDGAGAGLASVTLFVSTDGGASWSAAAAASATSPTSFVVPGPGAYAFSVRALDLAGNLEATPVGSASIEASTTVLSVEPEDGNFPVAIVLIDGGVAAVNTPAVTLTLAVVGFQSPVQEMRLSHDGTEWGPWEPFVGERAFTLGAAEGRQEAHAQFRDAVGNLICTGQAGVLLDRTAPLGAVRIGDGEARTHDPYVRLALTAADNGAGAVAMALSTDGERWSAWERFAPTRWFSLSAVDGKKTVFVRFRDAAGNVSTAASAAITLDRTVLAGRSPTGPGPHDPAPPPPRDTRPPVGHVTPLPEYVTRTTVEISWTVSGGTWWGVQGVRLYYTTDGGQHWVRYGALFDQSPIPFPAPAQGTYGFAVAAQDQAGNGEPPPLGAAAVEATTTVDVTPPTGSLVVDGGAASALSDKVFLNLQATDIGSGVRAMRISSTPDQWGGWQGFRPGQWFTLAPGAGRQAVYVQYQDEAGNISEIVSAGIAVPEPLCEPLPSPASVCLVLPVQGPTVVGHLGQKQAGLPLVLIRLDAADARGVSKVVLVASPAPDSGAPGGTRPRSPVLDVAFFGAQGTPAELAVPFAVEFLGQPAQASETSAGVYVWNHRSALWRFVANVPQPGGGGGATVALPHFRRFWVLADPGRPRIVRNDQQLLHPALELMIGNGLLAPDAPGVQRPDASINRLEFRRLLVQALRLDSMSGRLSWPVTPADASVQPDGSVPMATGPAPGQYWSPACAAALALAPAQLAAPLSRGEMTTLAGCAAQWARGAGPAWAGIGLEQPLAGVRHAGAPAWLPADATLLWGMDEPPGADGDRHATWADAATVIIQAMIAADLL